ncbi:MAG: hypothetical protein V1765_00265 [bacterium]
MWKKVSEFWGAYHYHRQIRTITKHRIIRQLTGWPKPETVNAYRGLLKHGHTYKIKQQLKLNS